MCPSPRGSNGFKIHQKGEGLDVLEGEASLCVPLSSAKLPGMLIVI